MELISQESTRDAAVIDIGGGASTLVDDLLAAGYHDVSVLDIAATGMEISQARLGAAAAGANWIVADLLAWQPPRRYDVWHDRAVLHFLTEPDDQDQYRRTLLSATHPGSVAVIGVFGPDGPQQCSGLAVRRYGEAEITELLGESFIVTGSFTRDHTTPNSGTQQFTWTTATRR
jgi:trans-aconitate methyltransferase